MHVSNDSLIPLFPWCDSSIFEEAYSQIHIVGFHHPMLQMGVTRLPLVNVIGCFNITLGESAFQNLAFGFALSLIYCNVFFIAFNKHFMIFALSYMFHLTNFEFDEVALVIIYFNHFYII